MYCAILLMCNCAQASVYFHLICANNNDNDNDNDIFQGLTIIIIIIIMIFLAYLYVQFISIKRHNFTSKTELFSSTICLKEKKTDVIKLP